MKLIIAILYGVLIFFSIYSVKITRENTALKIKNN